MSDTTRAVASVDCHILIDPDRPHTTQRMLQQLADEPVHVWRVPARPGEITAARIDAFKLGEAPYVCWVDDDDELTPGIFDALIYALDKNPHACGAFCSEAHIGDDGRILEIKPRQDEVWSLKAMIDKHPYVHHIALMRRSLLDFHLPAIRAFPRVGDQLLIWLMAIHGNWIHVPVVGYQWKRWSGQTTMDPEIKKEIEAAQAYARERFGLVAPGG